jgi:hypothetical protein
MIMKWRIRNNDVMNKEAINVNNNNNNINNNGVIM